MKTIKINEKEYQIECNAFTQVLYKRFFKNGIIKDMQDIKGYLIKQSVVANSISEGTEEQKLSQVADYMVDDIDNFIIKITQIAWILIYTANDKIEDYDTWMKSMKEFKITDDWIAEVADLAVDCFC